MKKYRVIFRKVKLNEDKGTIEAFFPDTVSKGMIEGYSHFGQHFETSIIYYRLYTTKANETEYQSLLNELNSIYFDCDLVVVSRINSKVK